MEHRRITLGLVQMGMGPDPEENTKKALELAAAAARTGAQVICLPELFRSQYFPQQIGRDVSSLAESVPGKSTESFTALARTNQAVIIVPVFEQAADGRRYNTAVVIDADGSIRGTYHKVHIPQDPGFFEKGYFYPGDRYAVHETRYGRIAVLICYDQWFPEAARCVALDGADLIIYPTAIGHPSADVPGEGDWRPAWELIQQSHAIASSVHVAAVNRVGTEGAIRFFGRSFVCDAFGNILKRAGGEEETLIVPIDLSMNRAVRDSWGFFRNRRPETYSRIGIPFPGPDGASPLIREGDTPRNRGYHMPAEWEPHEAIWMSWPHNTATFPRLAEVEEAYARFIAAIHMSERVELFVATPVINRRVRGRLRAAGVDLSRVNLRTVRYSDVWIRDYGPTFVVNRATNSVAMVRWKFNAWGGKYEDQIADGEIPGFVNRWLNLPVFIPGIILEGGSVDTNGRGTVLTSRSCLLNKNRNPHLSEADLEELLREYLGVTKVIWLNRGITGDDTDGHVDDMARFCGPSTIVCAWEENPQDENYGALKENFEILQKATDAEGNPFTVVKLPMPAAVQDGDGRYPASYTNFYIGNTAVIVPLFSDPRDAEALRILQELFPDRTVTGIDARAMVEGYGTFHCATQQQPLP